MLSNCYNMAFEIVIAEKTTFKLLELSTSNRNTQIDANNYIFNDEISANGLHIMNNSLLKKKMDIMKKLKLFDHT